MSTLIGLAVPSADAADMAVGIVSSTRNDVRAVTPSGSIAVNPGDAVFKGQTFRTGVQSVAVISLNDATILRVGPSSEVTIDDFVYSGHRTSNRLFEMLKSAFRFISGTGGSEIERGRPRSTSSTIAVRG